MQRHIRQILPQKPCKTYILHYKCVDSAARSPVCCIKSIIYLAVSHKRVKGKIRPDISFGTVAHCVFDILKAEVFRILPRVESGRTEINGIGAGAHSRFYRPCVSGRRQYFYFAAVLQDMSTPKPKVRRRLIDHKSPRRRSPHKLKSDSERAFIKP